MVVNKNDQADRFDKLKKIEGSLNINKLAEQIYQQIAGNLPEIDINIKPAKGRESSSILRSTANYSPIDEEIRNVKKKNDQEKIVLEDIDKEKGSLGKLKEGSRFTADGKIKVINRRQTIV